jgi:hypothetical protein
MVERIEAANEALGGAVLVQAVEVIGPELGEGHGSLQHIEHRDQDLVGDGHKKGAFEDGIDGQRAHLLAERRSAMVAIGAAAIDRVVAVRAGVALAHPAPAAPTRGDSLQQRVAPAHKPPSWSRCMTLGLCRILVISV